MNNKESLIKFKINCLYRKVIFKLIINTLAFSMKIKKYIMIFIYNLTDIYEGVKIHPKKEIFLLDDIN